MGLLLLQEHTVNKNPLPMTSQGVNGHFRAMRRCEGDCDRDTDCGNTGMKCFQRNGYTELLGCKTGGAGDVNGWDCCYQPTPFCSGGYSVVKSLAQCREAIRYLSSMPYGSVRNGNWNNWQEGCWCQTAGRNAYFNNRGCKDKDCGRYTLTQNAQRAGSGQICVDTSGPASTCNHVSTNKPGAPSHTCAKGYMGDGKVTGTSCTDFDACKNNTCPQLQGDPFKRRAECTDLPAPSMGPSRPLAFFGTRITAWLY